MHRQLVTTTFTQSAREKGVDFEFHMLEDADFMCVVSDLIERFVLREAIVISHSSTHRPWTEISQCLQNAISLREMGH